jgi:hypothetical protein
MISMFIGTMELWASRFVELMSLIGKRQAKREKTTYTQFFNLRRDCGYQLHRFSIRLENKSRVRG